MSQDPTRATGAPPQPNDPDQIRADIAAARAELGHTVNQLTAKLDVKTQASAKVTELRSRTAHSVEQAWQSAPPQMKHAVAAAGNKFGPPSAAAGHASPPTPHHDHRRGGDGRSAHCRRPAPIGRGSAVIKAPYTPVGALPNDNNSSPAPARLDA